LISAGLTPIWLLALALVLGFSLRVFAPIVAVGRIMSNYSDWFGLCRALSRARWVTLAAATLAWRAVQGQIRQAENAIEAVRAKEEFASRAVLPFALSSLHTYVAASHQATCRAALSYGARTKRWSLTELPMDDVSAIRSCIRYAAAAEARADCRNAQISSDGFKIPDIGRLP